MSHHNNKYDEPEAMQLSYPNNDNDINKFFIENPRYAKLIPRFNYIFDDDYWENNDDELNPFACEMFDEINLVLHELFARLERIVQLYPVIIK